MGGSTRFPIGSPGEGGLSGSSRPPSSRYRAGLSEPIPLRVLLVEDNEDDTLLLVRELERGGYEVSYRPVQTAEALRAALCEKTWDLILSDYSLPEFSAPEALAIVKSAGVDIPFIIVSGAVGEESAVEALKTGAHDFLLKDRLARFHPAVERELREARSRLDHRKTLAQLQEAERARDEFLSIASHELRTPITSLVLHLERTLRLVRTHSEEIPVPGLVTGLESVYRQVDRLTVLIKSILDVTRITSGRLTLSASQLELRALIQRVMAHVKETLYARSELKLTAETEVWGCWDPGALETVISHLLSNAVKFGESKPIDVAVRREGNWAVISVQDAGIGMSAEDQGRLFQRFGRAVSSHHFGGFGVGLWISKQLVEAHGGSIRVTSDKGAGTIVVVLLPLAEGTQ